MDKIEQHIEEITINWDTFYTLYTETRFNKFQKWLWKHLLNIKITDVEE